jgi:YHS domain-containing protein
MQRSSPLISLYRPSARIARNEKTTLAEFGLRCSFSRRCWKCSWRSDQPTQTPVQNRAEKVNRSGSERCYEGNERAKVNVDSKGVILKGYDAVAYINEGKPVKGIPEIKSNYQGATYLFASAEDKADFDKDPLKFAPQYGGFCACGIALGVLADIEDSPKAFVV